MWGRKWTGQMFWARMLLEGWRSPCIFSSPKDHLSATRQSPVDWKWLELCGNVGYCTSVEQTLPTFDGDILLIGYIWWSWIIREFHSRGLIWSRTLLARWAPWNRLCWRPRRVMSGWLGCFQWPRLTCNDGKLCQVRGTTDIKWYKVTGTSMDRVW